MDGKGLQNYDCMKDNLHYKKDHFQSYRAFAEEFVSTSYSHFHQNILKENGNAINLDPNCFVKKN